MPQTSGVPSNGEMLNHCTGIRMRVTGDADLLMTLCSLDNMQVQVLVPFRLQENTHIQPFRLANFIQQRASLLIETNAIYDYFRIKRIVFYVKPVAVDYPGSMNALPTE